MKNVLDRPILTRTAPLSSHNQKKIERLYYFDWLRVIAFSILIIMHSAEVFATTKWWMKNAETSLLVDYIITFFKQWRMPLLFIISGAAISIMMKKRSTTKFLQDRIVRILLPLIAGIFLIIPPQIYFIWKADGYQGDWLNFYLSIFEFNWFPKGNMHWLHLWYLAFVFGYSLLIIPIIQFLKTEKGTKLSLNASQTISRPIVLFFIIVLLSIPFYIMNSLNLNGNLVDLVYFFPYFLFGSLFVTQRIILKSLSIICTKALQLAILCTLILYLFFLLKDTSGNPIIDIGVNISSNSIFFMVLRTLNQWFWLIAILGFSIRHLNFGSKALTYANKAVYPFYIFHQTIIVVIGYYVVQTQASILQKFLLIFLLTMLSILVLYEFLLKRTKLTKLLFGIKV